jgi:general secretion pathway protein A
MDAGSHRNASAAASAAVAPKTALTASQPKAVAGATALKPVNAAASSVAAAPSTDPGVWLKSLIRNEAEAWRELAPAWKLALGDGDPCEAALEQEVRCFRSTSSNLALMRQLGRPGIVTLRDESHKTGYALLTGLTEQTATLRIGGVVHTVPLPMLAQMWRGDFATFWRAPAGYVNMVRDGEASPVVDTLATQLASALGEPAPVGAKQRFDATLKSRVTTFQLAQGLKADGVPGPTTFMQLNRATGVDEPRLNHEK